MLRPEPPAESPSTPSRMVGRWNSRASRPAAMPTTPRCQPSAQATRIGGSSASPAKRSRAASSTRVWASRRTRLRSSSSSASCSARSGSRVSSSSRAGSASPIRPAALIRGPMRKPMSDERSGSLSRQRAISARSPGDGVCRQRRQADRRDDPVLAAQRHHVGHRAETGDPQQGLARYPPAAPGGHRLGQLEGHAGGAQPLGARRTGGAARVHLDHPRRQLDRRQVVVGDDQLEPGRQRRGGRPDRAAAAVGGHQQRAAVLVRPLDVAS